MLYIHMCMYDETERQREIERERELPFTLRKKENLQFQSKSPPRDMKQYLNNIYLFLFFF